MTLSPLYQINPQALHETITEEVVIVDLVSGNYYSLTGTGAEIWAWLEQGATLTQLSDRLLAKYNGDDSTLSTAIEQFLAELQAENLIITLAQHDLPPAEPTSIEASLTEPKPGFIAPSLNKYTDMQELFLIDPIHDVDESGWPNLAANR